MNPAFLALLLLVVAAQDPGAAARPRTVPPRSSRDRLLKLHFGDAAGYAVYRDAAHNEKAELRRQPVYVWTNPVRAHQQDGAVYVWTYRGRPEAIGSIFSAPGKKVRSVNHEFHSLALAPLSVVREGTHEKSWNPEAPGLVLKPIADAPAPAGTAAKRLAQMRALARDFSATSRDAQDKRWELRLLSQPLYRYESTDRDLTDGALFAFVTSAGTDPELLLLIEARIPSGGGQTVWQQGIARFSDLELTVRHKGVETFTAPLIRGNLKQMYPKQEYQVFRDRGIPAVEGEAP